MVDLYELKLTERRRFVKLFLESLIRLPRNIWGPTLVILDEAISTVLSAARAKRSRPRQPSA